MEMELKRKLNKIASLLDRHYLNLDIQNFYIRTLKDIQGLVDTEDCRIYEVALNEAIRLATYHQKQIRIREEERLLLGLGVSKEAKVIA